MNKAARWGWTVALLAATGVALVLAFVLSQSAQGDSGYERHFFWLFWVNVSVAALLVAVIAFVALRLVVRVRTRKFGSRLLIRLAGIFAMVGLLPGLVIYTVSYQFVSRSIEAWFTNPREICSSAENSAGFSVSQPNARNSGRMK